MHMNSGVAAKKFSARPPPRSLSKEADPVPWILCRGWKEEEGEEEEEEEEKEEERRGSDEAAWAGWIWWWW